MLASAGVAGLVAGIAPNPALSNLLAGMQIALTEPIRIDDVVIVEGEWGTDRGIEYHLCGRLYLGSAPLDCAPHALHREALPKLDPPLRRPHRHGFPLHRLHRAGRRNPKRIAPPAGSKRPWDRKVCVLQVTDAKEHTIEVARVGQCGQCRSPLGPALRRARSPDSFLPGALPPAPASHEPQSLVRRLIFLIAILILITNYWPQLNSWQTQRTHTPRRPYP